MSELLFGYNTNGFAHHRIEDALAIIGKLGYRSVALTLDHHVLNPLDRPHLSSQIHTVRELLAPLRSGAAIETGARFLLDPWHKHQPTLISPSRAARATRLALLNRAVDLAARLQVEVVSFWSGTSLTNDSDNVLLRRLVSGCRRLADRAAQKGVRLAFEPEPGMFIDTMDKFETLFDRVHHPAFGLTIDIGHLHCQGELPIEKHLRRWKDVLWNIHIEDMRRGVHDHLMFGEGEIDFAPVMQTLAALGYSGGVHVELSRHSHDAVKTAKAALDFLWSITTRSGT